MSRKRPDRRYLKPQQLTDHHMVPRSRLRPDRRNVYGRRNIKRVAWQYHDAWHRLFINMTPYEAAICIIEHFAPKGYFSQVVLKVEWENAIYQYRLSENREPILMVDSYTARRNYRHYLKRLFAGKDWVAIVSEIVTSWSPSGYWQTAIVRSRRRGRKSSFSYKKTGTTSR